jgi:hypothetical protein
MMSRAAITTLPIWNALRRSYLKLLLFLLRPIVSLSLLLLLKASSMNTLRGRSMVAGRDPVNRHAVPQISSPQCILNP